MPIPREAQEKMISYNFILNDRYPPSIPYTKLSAGYSKSSEAVSDTTPIYSLYTNDDEQPNISSAINIDQIKSIRYNGGDFWYHVFDSSSADSRYIILIDSRGIVTNKLTY
jgi:hypothetical protein